MGSHMGTAERIFLNYHEVSNFNSKKGEDEELWKSGARWSEWN